MVGNIIASAVWSCCDPFNEPSVQMVVDDFAIHLEKIGVTGKTMYQTSGPPLTGYIVGWQCGMVLLPWKLKSVRTIRLCGDAGVNIPSQKGLICVLLWCD